MSFTFTDVEAFRVGQNAVGLATKDVATALDRQGLGLNQESVASLTWTAGGSNVVGATASTANIGRIIYNEDTLELYRIVSATNGVFYVVDRAYTGTAGSNLFDTFVADAPVSGVLPTRNPAYGVMGGD